MSMIGFFFFYWYGDHRDLHSFPTRRSSDLPIAADDVKPLWIGFRRGVFASEHLRKRELRSEEHTSELQSRFDLVCRLLLEKKKTKPSTIPQTTHITLQAPTLPLHSLLLPCP